jgi:hypothetical protein
VKEDSSCLLDSLLLGLLVDTCEDERIAALTVLEDHFAELGFATTSGGGSIGGSNRIGGSRQSVCPLSKLGAEKQKQQTRY